MMGGDVAARKLKKPALGPFGEPIFPGAKPDLELDQMVRYRTRAPFDEIARFYEQFWTKSRLIKSTRTEADGHPCFALGANEHFEEGQFASILVMIDPKTKDKKVHHWHILVIART